MKEEDNSLLLMPQDKKHYRHQRLLRKRVDSLSTSQGRMEKQIQRLEERLQGPSHYQRVTTNDVLEEDLTKRVLNLEDNNRKTSKALFNVSRQVRCQAVVTENLLQKRTTINK